MGGGPTLLHSSNSIGRSRNCLQSTQLFFERFSSFTNHRYFDQKCLPLASRAIRFTKALFNVFPPCQKERKFYSFQSRPWAHLVYFKINKCVCDSQPHTVDTCEIVCVTPNLCILRFVSLLRRLAVAQSYTDFSCNINFKSNNNNSKRETTLITKSQNG